MANAIHEMPHQHKTHTSHDDTVVSAASVEDMVGGRDDFLGGAARDLSTNIARRLATAGGSANRQSMAANGGVRVASAGSGSAGGGVSGSRSRHSQMAGDREDSPLQSKRSSTFGLVFI